ncbi:MAG: hypothetical protein VYC32_11235 [Planctomycetota bacterium]|nr:hypothetical protein [Planctomycetota bacterium]
MKFSLKFVVIVLSLAVVYLPAAGSLLAQDKDSAADASKPAPEPEFKSEKYKESYDKGKKEFEAGEYKDASRSFKKALSGARTKEDKAQVNKWILGCKGSSVLKKIEQYKKRNLWNEAYDQVLIALQRYGETPISGPLMKLFTDLENALFLEIENFNFSNTSLYSAKYGKSFVKDPAYLANGTQCLRWQNTRDGKPGMLKISNVPRNWSQFKSLEFWIALQVSAIPAAVVMSAGGAKPKGAAARTVAPRGQAVRTFLISKVPVKKTKAWQYVRIPLASLKSQGGATLEAVTDFRIQVPGGKTFNFLVDDIRLRKKNPQQAAGGPRKR